MTPMEGPDPDSWRLLPATPGERSDIGPNCPITVARAPMTMEWNQLTFLHWSYDPDAVQALLPPGLTVDTFDERAWVSLVPFLMVVRAGRRGELPWLSRFCETNVRTYVTAPDGSRGVWFLSLDAGRLPAVLTARSFYQLPYFWSSMSYHRAGDVVAYRCRRLWPRPYATPSLARVRIGAPYRPDELEPRDHFLSALWRLYSTWRGHLRYALAEHEPWVLHRAELLDLDDGLVMAAGLPAPSGDPLCQWSPGVTVRVGYPHRVPG